MVVQGASWSQALPFQLCLRFTCDPLCVCVDSGEYHKTCDQHQGEEECNRGEQRLWYAPKPKGFQDRYELDLSVVPHGLTAGLVESYHALSPRSQDAGVRGSDPSVHVSSFGVGRWEVSDPCHVVAGFESVILRCVRLQLEVKRVLNRETGRLRRVEIDSRSVSKGKLFSEIRPRGRGE